MSYKRFSKIILGFKLMYVISVTSHSSAKNTTPPSIQDQVNSNAEIAEPIKPGKRYERSSYSKCAGDKYMTFDPPNTFTCKYDDLCYQVFKDCCSDFVKQCGNQTLVVDEGIKLQWQCIKLSPKETGLKGFPEQTGLWMIGRCPSDWPLDLTRAKCVMASNYFSPSRPLDEILPVVSKVKRLTYRNKFCAICNHVTEFVSFYIKATTRITPPESFDLTEKLKFIKENHGEVWLKIPHNRRYCLGENYIETCENTSHPLSEACLSGPVEIVRKSGWEYYKNKHCAQCNKDIPCIPRGAAGPGSQPVLCPTKKPTSKPRPGAQPGQPGPPGQGIREFSLVFTMGHSNLHTTYIEEAPPCPIYDKDLQICHEGIITTAKDNLSNKFLVLITFIISEPLKSEITSHLIEENFELDSEQISALDLHYQEKVKDNVSPVNIYTVASFYLTLTPFQELILENQKSVPTSLESRKFLRIFNFSESYKIYWKTNSFTIIKVVTKRLACYQGKKLRYNEYSRDNISGVLYEKATGRNYSLNDYSILYDRSYIVLCSKLVLSDCINGSYVKLFTNEFVILPDLSLYHNASNMIYEFGDYQITERLNESSQYTFSFPVDKIHKNGTSRSKKNVSVSVCLPRQRTYTRRIIRHRNRFILELLTLFGFSVSSLFLLGVLITYALFPELRTLPGLNLMSLALSMFLSNLVWLIGIRRFHGRMVCVVLAVFNHYLLLVTFHAMSVISHHSSYVFSQSFVLPRSDKRLKTFTRYSLFVWLHPAVFITICFILDKLSIFTINYGVSCWLGTKNALIYLFLLPVAVLFIFNIASFVRMAVNLNRNKNQTDLLKKNGRQNLKVCMKLSTLVSFPWLFGFFRLIFPTFEAFEYLFVIFACFQGFCIGVAFLCTEKTLKLYRKRFTPSRTECTNVRGLET